MHQIYPDNGLLSWLTRMMSADVNYHLFTNDVTPTRDTVLGDLTEAAFSGYAVHTVTLADFTLSGVTGHVGTMIGAPFSFTNESGGPVNAYGYYITNTANTVLLGIARFDSAPVTKADDESWLVTPSLSDLSQYAS